MIKYDWNVLRQEDVKLILRVLLYLTNRELNKLNKTRDRAVLEVVSRFKYSNAFLLNPLGLIVNKKRYTDQEIFLYIELASLRSYTNYKRTGSKSLPTYYINVGLDKLKFNKALYVTNETVGFVYEEI
jgi:hypothetical protein